MRLSVTLPPPLSAAAALAFENWSGMVGAASLLAWAAVELLSQLWAACTLRPHLLVQLLGGCGPCVLEGLHLQTGSPQCVSMRTGTGGTLVHRTPAHTTQPH